MAARNRLAVLVGLLPIVLAAGVAAAQSAPSTGPNSAAAAQQAIDTQALLDRLDAQEKRIEALEKKLAQQSDQIRRAPSEVTSSAPDRQPTTPAPSATSAASATSAPSAASAASATAPTTPAVTPRANAEPAAQSVVAHAGSGGFWLASADDANVIRFRGNFAFDGRWYSDDVTPNSQSTWLLRKVRPYLEGTLGNIYDFRVMPDFGNGKTILLEAYIAARFEPWFVFQAGKFKAPVGLERLQPDQFDRFVELGFPSVLVPNRDLGVQIGGDLSQGLIGYAIGYFDGVTDGNSTDSNPTPDSSTDGKKDWEGRVFFQPFVKAENPYLRGLGAGIAGTYVNFVGNSSQILLPTYKTPSQQSFFAYRSGASPTYADGQRSRWSPQLYYYAGSFGLLGEYVGSDQDLSRKVSNTETRSGRVNSSAWQVQLAWFLSGERESYNGFIPKSTFSIANGSLGAWELVARAQQLRIGSEAFFAGSTSFADPAVSPRRASALGVGVNWYLNQNLKWMLDFERTLFQGGAANGGDRAAERVALLQIQATF